mmetsp:Transcript_39771/g.44523  ORF Transcript_39771/g.44523 Transcript_39771/m.44523 type:complete len:93 (+) Transcript_39771:4040-4318(+)
MRLNVVMFGFFLNNVITRLLLLKRKEVRSTRSYKLYGLRDIMRAKRRRSLSLSLSFLPFSSFFFLSTKQGIGRTSYKYYNVAARSQQQAKKF